ncbi:MAG: hypothetical protein ABJZ55_20500 [Fuerstiella sp.]
MIVEIYSGSQYSERSYSEDQYDEDHFGEDGQLHDGLEAQWFILTWHGKTSAHLSDADIHGPYLENHAAVNFAGSLSRLTE